METPNWPLGFLLETPKWPLGFLRLRWSQREERGESAAAARYLSIGILLRMFDPKDARAVCLCVCVGGGEKAPKASM